MTTPEEEARKKSAEAKAKEPEKSSTPSNDALSVIGQLFGDGKNVAFDALSGMHSGDKVLSSITPQLAAEYQLGKEVRERIASGAIKENQLSASDKKHLEAFEGVRKSISQVPLYDRDSLTRYVEKGIQQKAKAAAAETSHPVAAKEGAIHRAPGKQTEHPVAKDGGEPKKSAAHPAQSARKDVQGPTTTGVSADTKVASQKPTQAIRPQERTDAWPQERDVRSQDRNVSPRERDVRSQDREVSPQEREVRPQARTDERPLESNTSNPRTQSDHSAGIAQRDVKPEEVRNPLVLDKKELTFTTAQGFKVSKAEPYVSNTFREGAQAISTFERRTGYDARVYQESKQNQYGRNTETQIQNPNQARAIGLVDNVVGRADVQVQRMGGALESSPRLVTQRDAMVSSSPYIQRSFENMRRILDERTSVAEVQSQRSPTFERSEIKSAGSAETRDVQQHLPGVERKVSLSEIRNNLSEHRVQQIVRISEERFPAGLRWQNTIRHSDVPSTAGKSRAPEAPGSNFSVKSADRGAGNVSTRPGMPGDVSQNAVRQNSIATAKVLSFNGRVTDRYITGAEIALAAIIAAAGAKRIRFDETLPGADVGTQIPRVQKIQAFLPHKSVSDKGTPRTDVPKLDQKRSDVPSAESKSATSPRQSALRQETFTSTFKPTEKRFLTGVEVALAAIIASCGTARIRQNLSELPPEDRMPAVHMEESNELVMNATSSNATDSNDKSLGVKEANEQTSKVQESREQDSQDDNIPGTLQYLQTHKFNRRTILIGSSDTFVSIAERDLLNKDGNLGWLIADINLNRIKETYLDGKRIVEVRSRQTIEIPTADEIIVFMRHRKDEYKAENLVTIVVETQLDRELLNERLGVFVDREEKTTGLLPKYENL